MPQPILDFGFASLGLILVNKCGDRLFYNPAGQAATTAMAYVSCGDTLALTFAQDVAMCGLGLTTTTTATAATAGPEYSATAWKTA